MSDLNEMRALVEEGNRTLEELREKSATKADLADVVRAEEVKKIKADLAGQFAAEAEKRGALEAKLTDLETAASRPANGGAAQQSEEMKGFSAFLARGDESHLDTKAMATNQDGDGGFLVPREMAQGVQARMRRHSPIRRIANVVAIQANIYDILVERGDSGYDWTGETATIPETDTPTIDRISIALHELAAMPKVSQRLLDSASFDVAGWLGERIADRFARAEGAACIAGDGANKPKGIVSYATANTRDASRAAQTLQYRASGASGAFPATNPADVLAKGFYDLQGVYQANATWIMNVRTAGEVAVLKDGNGRYLIQGMYDQSGAFVRTVMGRPVEMMDDMPDLGAGSLSIAVGDFDRGYTLVDGLNIRILRDPFSAKPHVLFYATRRLGGGVTDFDAIKLIRFANS